jgi:hypothetical protein
MGVLRKWMEQSLKWLMCGANVVLRFVGDVPGVIQNLQHEPKTSVTNGGKWLRKTYCAIGNPDPVT